MSEERPTAQRRRSGLHGRRVGKPLSARRLGLMASLLPELRLDLSRPAPTDLSDLFPARKTSFRLEIGFGGGEHLLAEAERLPEIGFIGAEPFVNGVAKAVAAITERGIGNVRLHDDDAVALLDWLPAGSLAEIALLYPDPWPKRRHWKRRFVSRENLDRFARLLKPGGFFRFASDVPSYVSWTLFHLSRRNDFAWTAERADDWRKPWADWPGTRYERTAIREGRVPTYLAFERT